MSRTTLCALIGAWMAVSAATAGGAIHGTIESKDGRTFTGPIRWDVNEVFWDDTLNALKTKVIKEAEEDGYRFSLLGWEIVNTGHSSRTMHAFSIPFGHLQAIEPLSAGEALLLLKNGEELEVRSGSTDIGNAMRGIVIEDREHGEQGFAWHQVRRIEFSSAPEKKRDAQRLYGTVEMESGAKLTGYIVWDADEALGGDMLDGEDDDGEHEIAFAQIRTIEPQHDGSRVVLKSGDELVLEGSNDVDVHHGHRWIVVFIPGVGHAELKYSNVLKVTFADAPASPSYDTFDGGRRLQGTVRTVSDQSHSGRIVWDRDETHTFETLDGEVDDVKYAVLFEKIRSITPQDSGSSEVRLIDDRILLLSGSNDVNASNKGVIVELQKEDGPVELQFEWEEIAVVEFD
jgi:hypothetical protein